MFLTNFARTVAFPATWEYLYDPSFHPHQRSNVWIQLTKPSEFSKTVLAVWKVVPGVQYVNSAIRVNTDERVHYMGAQFWIYVGWIELTDSGTISGPAAIVADDLV